MIVELSRSVAQSLSSGDAPASMTPALAPLPFGQASAKRFDDIAVCGDFMNRLPNRPSVFDAVGPGRDFRIGFRPLALPSLDVFAGSSTPKLVDHESARVALVVPFGICGSVVRSGRTEHRWASPHLACVIPAHQHITAQSTAGAFVRIDVTEQLLARTAAGLAPEGGREWTVRETRTVPLADKDVNWLEVIASLCETIDACGCDEQLLAVTGLDDVLLRTVAMMLWPEIRHGSEPAPRQARGLELDPLIDRVMTNLGERITLSDMERWSDRSARALQLAFLQRFGLSPMQWLRERRIDLLRERLLTAAPGASVAEIARSCGLARPTTVVADYLRRFGERPSETLARSRR